jgi:hypothetical protein
MSRQPLPGAGATAPVPSGAAARAPAPFSSPLPPQRYGALRARYNALLVTLYERSTLTLREIAAAGGCTKRAVQMLARVLGCRPRYPQKCRPGTSVGVRRAGPRLPPLNPTAARHVLAAFTDVARELAASADAHANSELQRATERAKRRAARTQARVMASAARELTHLAAVMENAAAARDALAAGGSFAQKWDPQRLRFEQEAGIHESHEAARRAKAATAAAPARVDEADRRIDEIAKRYEPGPRRPRIRRL